MFDQWSVGVTASIIVVMPIATGVGLLVEAAIGRDIYRHDLLGEDHLAIEYPPDIADALFHNPVLRQVRADMGQQ